MNASDFAFVAGLLKDRSGLIITPDKLYLLEARLTPIARKHGLDNIDRLAEALRKSAPPVMADEVVDAMTTNETMFFRDRTPFDQLKKTLIPALIEQRSASRSLRIWSAACSTGQEPYSLAMMLRDDFPALAAWKIEIVSTDISPTVLDRARSGLYSTFEVQRGLPIHMLIKHFDQVGEQWEIKPELRRMVDFRQANLLHDISGLGSFDIILCRNVLIYFDQPTKTKILNAISRRLLPHGTLVLGGAESIFGLSDTLETQPGLRGVYRRVAGQKTEVTAARETAETGTLGQRSAIMARARAAS